MSTEKDALAVFLGEWSATGTAYGADRQGAPWHSIHSARWHTGNFFIVQDERANGPFNTMSFLGWDPDRETYFCWSIENHGFARQYLMEHENHAWSLTGESERATIIFTDDGHTQTHHWEFRPNGQWITLCDRVATRVPTDPTP